MRSGRFILAVILPLMLSACKKEEDVLTLKVANWEEYIDLGDWEEDELMVLDDGRTIFGERSLIEEFEDWYEESCGQKIRVEYSTFGTNEDLYNQITLGDVYDLVCPSEYMIMKLMREGRLEEFDEDFFDKDNAVNSYARGVSPYINEVFEGLSSGGECMADYVAGYMWGTLGIVYNPELVTREEASHWELLLNKDYYKTVTIKDSVRDAYFAALAMEYYDEITDETFIASPDYHEKLSEILNRTDEESVMRAQDILSQAKDNVYSFETDAGKADMVTGKVAANQQWSGDAVYVMEQAAEDDVMLCYSAPEEGTNLWFDGWVMLSGGIGGDKDKKQAAQAFVNFISRPENAIRNMYYIGYTSVISGGDDDMILDYARYCYEADDDDTVSYDIGYFFGDEGDDGYSVMVAPESFEFQQLSAKYPQKNVVDRAVVMACFDDEGNERINRMWTGVRCFDIRKLFML